MRTVSLVQLTRVTKPCPLASRDWAPDERAWHCGVCDLDVHNLSAMSGPEADALLSARHGHLCARYVADGSGAPITADRPWALRWAAWRSRIHAAAAALGLAALLGSRLGGCVPLGGVTQTGGVVRCPDPDPAPQADGAPPADPAAQAKPPAPPAR